MSVSGAVKPDADGSRLDSAGGIARGRGHAAGLVNSGPAFAIDTRGTDQNDSGTRARHFACSVDPACATCKRTATKRIDLPAEPSTDG